MSSIKMLLLLKLENFITDMWIILAEIVAALGAFFLTAILQGIVSSARYQIESANGYKKKAKKTLERLEKKDNDDGKRKLN